jgi:hypothetical protein
LLGIESDGELKRSPFRGALFEGMVAAEIVMEVDFVAPAQNARETVRRRARPIAPGVQAYPWRNFVAPLNQKRTRRRRSAAGRQR